MSDFPKYQFSYFIDNGAQLVVRAEDFVELFNAIDKVTAKYPIEQAKVSSRGTITSQNTIVEMCSIHNTPLKERISKAGKPYKSHVRKVGEDWDRCFGKGWMSEIQGQSSEEIGARI